MGPLPPPGHHHHRPRFPQALLHAPAQVAERFVTIHSKRLCPKSPVLLCSSQVTLPSSGGAVCACPPMASTAGTVRCGDMVHARPAELPELIRLVNACMCACTEVCWDTPWHGPGCRMGGNTASGMPRTAGRGGSLRKVVGLKDRWQRLAATAAAVVGAVCQWHRSSARGGGQRRRHAPRCGRGGPRAASCCSLCRGFALQHARRRDRFQQQCMYITVR